MRNRHLPPSKQQRWFLASAVIGMLYDASIPLVTGFCALVEIMTNPLFVYLMRKPA
jgi:hypothetical protein